MTDANTILSQRRSAEQGNAEAQFYMGCVYANGDGVPKDDAQALLWYRKAAAQKHSGAQNNLGWMYDQGRGVPKDSAEAANWYLKAAQNGSAVAQNNMGVNYENGTGVEKSITESIRWYEAAAAQGHEDAKKNLERLKATIPQVKPPPPLPKPSTDAAPSHRKKRERRGEHCNPLLAACNPTVYRHNAFRLTGLPVDATTRQLKRRIDDLKAAEEIDDADEEHTHAFALDPPPTTDQIREAAQRLNDPERRIIEEFFWFWPTEWGHGTKDPSIAALVKGDKDTAFGLWSAAVSNHHGPATVVAKHNLAVMYHLVALDSEHLALNSDLEPAQLATVAKHWRTSFKWWEELADDETFWSIVTDRIRLMDDPRLTTGFARRMRTTLPEAMDKINALLALAFIERGKHDLAMNHITYMIETNQGQDDVAATMALVTEPLISRLKTAISHAETAATQTPKSSNAAAANLLEVAQEPVAILRKFLPDKDPQLVDVCDAIVNACLHCHRAYVRAAPDEAKTWNAALRVLKAAKDYAATEELKTEVAEAEKDATRSKHMAHPQITIIANLLSRAHSEPLQKQLTTLSKEVSAALDALANELKPASQGYRLTCDLVASALRGLSVDLINRGQAQLTKVFEVLGNEQQRRMLGLMIQAGDQNAIQFEERKWNSLIDVAIGIDLYDQGRKLAQTKELQQRFAEDAEALSSMRQLCSQVAGDLHSKRRAKGLLFQWGSQPPPVPVSSSGSSTKSSSGCFVATAVYGSYDHPAVLVLRAFRDRDLMPFAWGRLLVRTYYRVGPWLAAVVRRSPASGAAARTMLDRIVRRLTKRNARTVTCVCQDSERTQ